MENVNHTKRSRVKGKKKSCVEKLQRYSRLYDYKICKLVMVKVTPKTWSISVSQSFQIQIKAVLKVEEQ